MKTLKNQVTLIGNLGKDPKITQTAKGYKMASFSLATHMPYKKKDGKVVSDTTWHLGYAIGQAAEFLENYGRKGAEMMIQGKIVEKIFVNPKGESQRRKMIEVNTIHGF